MMTVEQPISIRNESKIPTEVSGPAVTTIYWINNEATILWKYAEATPTVADTLDVIFFSMNF